MVATVIERPLYGRITFETTNQSGTFSWVDHTSKMTSLQYSEGGRFLEIGRSMTDVGILSASFRDLTTVPTVGNYVRLRRTGTSEYFFTGYVQDVTQRIVYDGNVALSTPIVLTTLICCDWVGMLSQFVINGITGLTSAGATTAVPYTSDKRVNAINYAIDNTMATTLVQHQGTPAGDITHTDAELTASAHLDLLSWSMGGYWFGQHTLPTNNTTGRDNLIEFRVGTPVSSGKTFTDVAGSAGNLHYTEIDFESSSANISNSLNMLNHSALLVEDVDVTIVGGGNVRDKIPVYTTALTDGLMMDNTYKVQDATSIGTYGERLTEIDLNLALVPEVHNGVSDYNLASNPNLAYDDVGWGYTTTTTIKGGRRETALDTSNAFTAYDGTWAYRAKVFAAGASATLSFRGAESDGTPVVAGNRYRIDGVAARSTTPANTEFRMQLRWLDDDENTLSTTSGSYVALTSVGVWYSAFAEAVAPANAVRVNIRYDFRRADSTNFATGTKLYASGMNFYRQAAAGQTMTYFTGDTADDANYLYFWTGQVGQSPSTRVKNSLTTRGNAILSAYSTSSVRATRIRWNAQEDLTAISTLTVGKTISVVYKGTTTTYRIIGIDGQVEQERYMIDYYLLKV